MQRRYFDWAASSPPDGEILARSLKTSLELFGNPSSRHRDGRLAREALENARSRIASVLAVPPKTVFFTSGGTEADQLAILSLLRSASPTSGLLVSAIEHPAVSECAALLARAGRQVSVVRCGRDGRVSPDDLASAISRAENPRMAAVMAVNNETGAVNDIPALVRAARQARPGLRFHCDAVQAAGKIPLDFSGWDVDSACISAHKFGGPRGFGILYARREFDTLSAGGGQEKGMRSGTENLFGALATAETLALYASREAVERNAAGARRLGALLVAALRKFDRCSLIPSDRHDEDGRYVPHILPASFRGIPGEVMARALDDRGFSVSTGSACASSSDKHPALEAMGIAGKTAFETIRISFGPSTSEEDIDALIRAVEEILKELP